MNKDPFVPKVGAHHGAIARLLEQCPELEGRPLYSRYLDICPAFISEETFLRYLAEVKAVQSELGNSDLDAS
jgi:hypothetical protein